MDKDTLISSFGKWVAPINSEIIQDWQHFGTLDRYTKKLSTMVFLLLFVEAQLQKRKGLRSIMREVQANEEFQQAIGIDSISAAQLSRKNNKLDPVVLQDILCGLISQLHRHQLPATSRVGPVKVIDSTTISLCLNKYKWATFRSTKAGVKLHLRVTFSEPGTVYPDKAVMTTANCADHTQMDMLIDEADATYLMDRGYLDLRKYDDYCVRGIPFVSRLKNRVTVEEVESFLLPVDSEIARDVKVILGTDKKRMKHPLRMIETTDSKGNLVRIITNRFDITAEELGDLYRSRWQIETFFRWVKQNLKMTCFYGTSENAVMNQIWVCMIAYCLLLLMKLEIAKEKSLTELSDRLRTLMWKSWCKLETAMNRKPSKTSKGRQKVRSVEVTK
ncbi:IS4 family transposase [Paenibacillus sp. J5C_2022]|uniref:IS4 family transposase n=1 Tax=Paenibacillus sp. J5C2022 TaxID=2977129 RepID=UPI0021D0FA1D|nr:IS4 family transposase [Paenibacillus sp. J5C2022]MCU6713266.1 IS4 family transposase [Paenibacillus sp. J5C2022]